MKLKKDLERSKQDLRLIRAYRKIAFRAHQAVRWLSRNFSNLHEDEIVANIVLGGEGATLPECLTYGEVLTIAQQYDWYCRQEKALRSRIRQLEEELEEELKVAP